MLVEARVPSLNLSQVTSQRYCTLVKGWSEGKGGEFQRWWGRHGIGGRIKRKVSRYEPAAAPRRLRSVIQSTPLTRVGGIFFLLIRSQ